jgi:glycosyltransferase involved in cell wall biosynthesis
MRLSVVLGTRGNAYAIPHLQRIFGALAAQTFQDFQVIVVVDRTFANEEEYKNFYQDVTKNEQRFQKVKFFTHLNSSFLPPAHGSNASFVRNFGMQQVDTALIQLFDDDNAFDEQYLEQAVKKYDEMKKLTKKEVVICPTLQYKETQQIQNQGFSHFCYWQSRPVRNFLGDKQMAEVQMFSGNGLLGASQLFQSV